MLTSQLGLWLGGGWIFGAQFAFVLFGQSPVQLGQSGYIWVLLGHLSPQLALWLGQLGLCPVVKCLHLYGQLVVQHGHWVGWNPGLVVRLGRLSSSSGLTCQFQWLLPPHSAVVQLGLLVVHLGLCLFA